MMDIPVIINNKNIITQLCFYTQNYLLAYYKPEKGDMNLENKITKANCISAESDHIIVEI